MDPVLLVGIISGGSAIVASVGAQTIGAIVTHRTERQRISAEAEHNKQAAAERERERFAADKRLAFVNYLRVKENYRRSCQALYLGTNTDERKAELTERISLYAEERIRIWEELSLLAPEVSEEIYRGERDVLRLHEITDDRMAILLWMGTDTENVAKLREVMRSSLGIASENFERHNQPQLNEAPVSGKTKPIKP